MLARLAKPTAPSGPHTAEDAKQIILKYRIMLKKTEEEHKKTIANANAQLAQLVNETNRAVLTQVEGSEVQHEKPQSAWIKGTDDEDFLLCNKAAVKQFEQLFEGFQEVIDLLQNQSK